VHEHLTVTRPLLAQTLAQVARERPDAHYYVAGSGPFVAAVTQELLSQGIERIESDEFKGLHAEL
jgi:hypothetical protein